MYFTRNNKRGKNKQNFINLKIYSAEWIDGLWQNIEELPFNDEVYSNCHPSLSKDGNSLYFASNRPGGFGKMDLYVSKKVNGVWQPPVNLGSAVNSSSNEIFPFIRNTGDLYFSSDNPSGFGKMDIYIAKANLLSNDFEQCANLGWEFNSIADEFGFYASPDKEEGYFSSNRPGGKGSDDIYYWQKIKVAVAPPQVQFSFLDAQTNEQLSDAVVTVFDEGIHSTKGDIYPIAKMVSLGIQKDNPYHSLRKRNYRTGSKGLINVIISEHKSYTVFIEKEGYLPIKKVLLEQDLKLQKKWNFKLVRKAGIPLKIEAISMPYQQKVPHVSLELYNHNTQKVERVISDDTGRFTFYINCDTEYTLLGKKDNYRRYKKHFSTKYQDCDRMKTIKSKLYLVTEEIVEHISKSETIRFSSLAKYQAQKVNKVGQIIRLEDIKFKENKAKLTPHIKQSLSKVLHFLQKNPHIRVEISNHTDARGSAIFNHSLSQKRADAIGNYLIQRGIPKEQISTIGYGEDRLINHCQNDIECQEEAHRQNKRTELKITKIRKKATQNALIRYSNQRY
jgi:outer membrane protein OmpA-like peptidoglycan-associated protein